MPAQHALAGMWSGMQASKAAWLGTNITSALAFMLGERGASAPAAVFRSFFLSCRELLLGATGWHWNSRQSSGFWL